MKWGGGGERERDERERGHECGLGLRVTTQQGEARFVINPAPCAPWVCETQR